MRVSATALVLTCLAVACVDTTAPSAELPLVLSVESADRNFDGVADPVLVQGRLRSLLVRGGPGLFCGVSAAEGTATLLAPLDLTVELRFQPLRSCPFAAVEPQYEAIVSGLNQGWYRVVVRQGYLLDQPVATVFSDSVYVTGSS